MSISSRLPDAETGLPRDVIELGRHIAALPEELQQDLSECYTRVVESTKRRRRILNLVQEALAQLRLDIKYLTFDLDMTRRERDELRNREY